MAEYLIAEVLHGMPASDRDFLLHTSVVREICPGLADELTGRRDSQRVLMDLSHCNAFLQQVPGSPGSYRMHSLFRELLSANSRWRRPARLQSCIDARLPGSQGSGASPTRWTMRWPRGTGWCSRGGHRQCGDRNAAPPTSTGTRMARAFPIPADVDSPEVSVVRAAVALARGDLDRAQAASPAAKSTSARPEPSGPGCGCLRTRLCDANGEAESTIAAAGHALGRCVLYRASVPCNTKVSGRSS